MHVRPADRGDVLAVCSDLLVEYVDQFGGQFVALVEDGRTTAIAGITPVGEFTAGLAHWAPGRKPGPRGTMRLARAALDLIKKHPTEVTAVADPEVPRSAELLAHLGFIHEDGNVWKWPCRSS